MRVVVIVVIIPIQSFVHDPMTTTSKMETFLPRHSGNFKVLGSFIHDLWQ